MAVTYPLIISIGRTPDGSGRLQLTLNGKTQAFGPQQSVPQSVSRSQHANLTIHQDGTIIIQNMKPANTTYVNGLAVQQKQVVYNPSNPAQSDVIQLGAHKYKFDWDLIKNLIPEPPKTIDLTPLKDIWQEYQVKQKKMAIRANRMQAIQSLQGLFTMGGLALGLIFSNGESRNMTFMVIGYGLAIAFLISLFIYRWKTAGKQLAEKEALQKWYQDHYVCPACGKYLGSAGYEILSQNDRCPHCKAVFNPK